ncbi:magnesium transporter [Desulfobacterales bacterium HSG2]|nr:magnesium transporter [Desulfobacterales bacterium HSG2]
MQGDRTKILVESIKRLLRRNAVIHLQKIVNKTHAADLSVVFPSLPLSNQHRLFDMIADVQQKGVLFSELDENTLLNFTENIELDEFVEILENMASDDVADLIGRLPEEKAAAVLEKMEKGSEEVEGLLRYKDDTAGGIMVPDFIALKQNTTARGAIESLQTEHSDVEMPFYLYVVDEYGKLVGVCSLRQLVVVPPETPLKEFMSTDVFSVQTDTDQEEVAKLVARYDILAVPVVNRTNVLEGIVTVDDVIDIFRAEATEDFLKMAGVSGEEFIETKSVIKSMRIRLPWLFASCVGGIFAFFVIGQFEESLTRFTYLAAFIPVIMGMGGNIGTQSSTIVVRGLATGLLDIRDIWSVVFKELAVGFILGIVYGTLIAVVAQFQYNLVAVAASVALAVLCSMSVAALVGSLVPMLFARINIDPAVATGPFVTTSIDIISVFFYFKIATTFLE